MPRTEAWASHQRYVASQDISGLLSGGLEALLREKPTDAATFLAAHFAAAGCQAKDDQTASCQLIDGVAQAKMINDELASEVNCSGVE